MEEAEAHQLPAGAGPVPCKESWEDARLCDLLRWLTQCGTSEVLGVSEKHLKNSHRAPSLQSGLVGASVWPSRGKLQQSKLLQEAGILHWVPRDSCAFPGFLITGIMEDGS